LQKPKQQPAVRRQYDSEKRRKKRGDQERNGRRGGDGGRCVREAGGGNKKKSAVRRWTLGKQEDPEETIHSFETKRPAEREERVPGKVSGPRNQLLAIWRGEKKNKKTHSEYVIRGLKKKRKKDVRRKHPKGQTLSKRKKRGLENVPFQGPKEKKNWSRRVGEKHVVVGNGQKPRNELSPEGKKHREIGGNRKCERGRESHRTNKGLE